MATAAHSITARKPNVDWQGLGLLVVINLIGVLAFITPFLTSTNETTDDLTNVRTGESLLLLAVLVIVCLIVLFAQLGMALNTRTIALLGVLLAANSVLRLLDVVVPLPGGFSPIFLLIILVGYCYGSQMGFLMGSLTLFSSSLLVGGVGPWLPFQMFTAGWVGLLAGWLPHRTAHPRQERWLLAISGAGLGMFYGFTINLYFWPFFAGDFQQSWQSGLTIGEGVARYLAFYSVTSLWWDVFRAVGNLILLLMVGPALLLALRRFRSRFFWETP